MKTWDELNHMHDDIMRIMRREQDIDRIKVQSAELEMLAFFRHNHNDQSVKNMKKMLEEKGMPTKPVLAEINMCTWFLKN